LKLYHIISPPCSVNSAHGLVNKACTKNIFHVAEIPATTEQQELQNDCGSGYPKQS